MARPQINIEKNFHRKVYKESLDLQVVVSAIPFTDDKIKSRVTDALLPYFDNNQDAVKELFKTNPGAKSIQFVATF